MTDQSIIDRFGRGLGAIPDKPDVRDYRFKALRAEAPPERAYVDLRRRLPMAYDQLHLGSCTAQAVAGAIEYDQRQQTGRSATPSRLSLYYDARKLLDPTLVTQDSGATLRTAIKAAVDFGAAPESLWPYLPIQFALEPSPQAREVGEGLQGVAYWRLDDGIISQMLVCLADGFPFVFGVQLYENFRPRRGVIPEPEGEALGGHAMLAVGYSMRSNRILVRNSWGIGWGSHGYAWFPISYMAEAWDCWTLRSVETV